MNSIPLQNQNTIAGLSTTGGAAAAEARIKQLQVLKATLTQRANARSLPINRDTFKLLLEEELQKAVVKKGTPATVPMLPKAPTPLNPFNPPDAKDAVKANSKLQPFPFAGSANAVKALPSVLPPSVQARRDAFSDDIVKMSQKYGVDPLLVDAVIRQESGYQPSVVSRSGAIGLMQLMPKTAAGLGVENPYDPIQNMEGGVKYLAQQLQRFGGNVSLALAAYNAGPNAVAKYGNIPPYAETQNYVRKILKNYLAQKYNP
jgi:soluble lytic murein transglycosylase-like protein